MTCPRCNAKTLVELDRSGIQIDRCTRCRGIWLDRGELDKLIADSWHDDRRDDGPDDDDGEAPLRGRRRNRDEDEGGVRGFFANLFD